MVDILSSISNYNWESFYNAPKKNIFDLADKDGDPHIIPAGINEGDAQIANTEFSMGLLLAQEQDEGSSSLQYTQNDEQFNEILADLFKKEEMKEKDEDEGDDQIYMLAQNGIGNQYLHTLEFDPLFITQKQTGNVMNLIEGTR